LHSLWAKREGGVHIRCRRNGERFICPSSLNESANDRSSRSGLTTIAAILGQKRPRHGPTKLQDFGHRADSHAALARKPARVCNHAFDRIFTPQPAGLFLNLSALTV
jgi:hypothetical protein